MHCLRHYASSPTVPTYQLYDLPHKFTPRLYMESEDPNLVLREIGVWGGGSKLVDRVGGSRLRICRHSAMAESSLVKPAHGVHVDFVP